MLDSLLRKKKERLVAVDIGTSAIKLAEVNIAEDGARSLVSLGIGPTPANAITNNVVTSPKKLADAILSVIESSGASSTKAAITIPGPTAFTKKITANFNSLKEFQENIAFEAGNYIPHKISAVSIDYQVLGVNPRGGYEVLLVAVKNDIIQSYIDAIEQAGLSPALVDIDFYSLATTFESNYPEQRSKTVALINIGARYSCVNILSNGESLFTGDVAVGGRLYTDALCETLEIGAAQAEMAKLGNIPEGVDEELVNETIDRTTEHVTNELHRQLGFFWSATASENTIEAIYVSGGASKVENLIEDLEHKTKVRCFAIDPFLKINNRSKFDEKMLESMAPMMGVCIGLATRRLGDKQHRLDEAA